MNDLISRSALLELAHNHVGGTVDCNDIARFPAVDAEVVRHGEWKERIVTDYKCYPAYTYKSGYECSLCGRTARTNKEPYCHCGARMDGGADGD